MANLCNIDGQITSEEDAHIPVLDRGFLFGDSIYEVVRTHGGVPLAWPEHWDRLHASAAALGMELDQSEATIARRCAKTMTQAAKSDCYVRVIVTRGTGEAPNIDVAYANSSPRWIIMVRPLQLASGAPIKLGLVHRLRNDRRALDPATKSGNYLNNVMGLAEAKAGGATDCVMLNGDGYVTEASTSNLFARIDGVWCTPPLEAGILVGITRSMLLKFLPESGETVEERQISKDELLGAEEIFLSSTLRDIGPVTHLNGRELHPTQSEKVGGPSTQRLVPDFRDYLARRLANHDTPHWHKLLTD